MNPKTPLETGQLNFLSLFGTIDRSHPWVWYDGQGSNQQLHLKIESFLFEMCLYDFVLAPPPQYNIINIVNSHVFGGLSCILSFFNYKTFPSPYPTGHGNLRLWIPVLPGAEVLDTNWILLSLLAIVLMVSYIKEMEKNSLK